MSSRAVSGPHKPTLIETMLNKLPVPYVVACAIFALAVGPLGQFTALLLDTRSIQLAVRYTFQTDYTGASYNSLPAAVIATLSFLLLVFFAPFQVRKIRETIITAEQDLAPLQQGETYDRVFNWASSGPYPILLAVPFFVFGFYYLFYSLPQEQGLGLGPLYLAYIILASILASLAFVSFVWIYSSSLWGLYNFGRQQLRLEPYLKDRILGLRPVGRISLALTRSYFIALTLLVLTVLITPDVASIILTIATVGLGIGFFFLPLKTCHDKLVETKRKAQRDIGQELLALTGENPGDHQSNDMSNELLDIKRLMILQMAQERVQSIPGWPLETAVLGRFTVLLVSVSAALLSRVIISLLRIP